MFTSSISLTIFSLVVLSIAESRGLKFPAIIVALSIPLFSSITFYLVYFEALLSGTYTFRITVFLGKLVPLSLCMSLFVLSNLLCFEINFISSWNQLLIFQLILTRYIFFHFFTFIPTMLLYWYLKWISYKQHRAGDFKISSANICLLIGIFEWFTFIIR